MAEIVHVDKRTIVDGGIGERHPAYVRNLTNGALVMIEQKNDATGIDIAMLAKQGQQEAAKLPKELGRDDASGAYESNWRETTVRTVL